MGRLKISLSRCRVEPVEAFVETGNVVAQFVHFFHPGGQGGGVDNGGIRVRGKSR